VSTKALTNGGARLLALLAVAACNGADPVEEAPGLTTMPALRDDLRLVAEATGLMEPVRTVEVKSKASGEILRLHVDTGDELEPGALLAEIDPRDVRNDFNQTEADLNVARARVEISTAQLERSRLLLEAGVITEAEHESATADLDAPADGQFWVSLPVVLANPGVAPREGDIVFLVDPGSPAEVDDEGNVTSPRIPPNVIEWRPLEGWDGLALNFWADADRYAYYTYLRDRLDGRAVVALPVVAGELTSGRLDALLAELDRALGRWSP